MYTTPNGVTGERLAAYDSAAAALSEERIDTTLRLAHYTVKDLAPPPEEPEDEYAERAAAAELAVASHGLASGWGTVGNINLSDISTTFDGDIRRVVKGVMGPHYKKGRIRSASVERG